MSFKHTSYQLFFPNFKVEFKYVLSITDNLPMLVSQGIAHGLVHSIQTHASQTGL
jgi:hypothetical protein